MSRDVENLLYFVGGAIVSGIATWFLTKKKDATIMQTELSKMDEYYKSKENKSNGTDMESIDKKLQTEPNKPGIHVATAEDIKKKPDPAKVEYNKITRSYISGEEDAINKAKEAITKPEEVAPVREGIFVIPEDAFDWELYDNDYGIKYEESYDHFTLDYYAGDDVLCFNKSEVHGNDILSLLPDKLPQDWRSMFDDHDCLYVRDTRNEIDYEIVRDKGSYRKIVLNLNEDDKWDYKKSQTYSEEADWYGPEKE